MQAFTLEQALQEGRIFVYNKSKPKGDILITFVQPSSGKNFVATIPKTWIPICVSDTVPLQVIEESVDFRSYLQNRMLQLVPRKEAETLLASTEAKEEWERIYTSKFAEDAVPSTDDEEKPTKPTVDVQKYIKEENLLVKDILERNAENGPSVVLNELRSIEEELTPADFTYVLQNSEGRVRAWAEKKLSANSTEA